MRNLLLAYLILLFIPLKSVSQEIVTGLTSNKVINNAWKERDLRKGTAADTLELPFFDDFSYSSVLPDSKKWGDYSVFINNSYSVNQVSEGIATFDALDNSGRLYETASSESFEADVLTSLPLNLAYPASDSIYLSFMYEPGGIADKPEIQDSLTLQFLAPAETKWFSVWRAPDIVEDTFKTVMIRITDPKYLQKGFKFRFRNYASLSSAGTDPSMAGNCDQWNIDYVRLKRNRNPGDTIATDVAFTLPVRSILKSNESMPWNQFRQVFLSEMGPWITVHYMNNDAVVRNVTRNFEILDVYQNSIVHSFSAGATNIDPHTKVDYKANLIYTFNSANTDSALFRIKSYITTDIFDPKGNDTIVYYQRFGNYFAFDDGTPEAGYGINGLGSNNAMAAYRFKSYIADTLRAITICFNDSYLNANLRSFDLMVWESVENVPGDLIYSQDGVTVTQGEGLNGFYTYILDDPQRISGDFFIGWRQRSDAFLNAGFDMNTPHNGKQMYWLNGDWNVSQTKGSIMIRPVFGPPKTTSSVAKVNYTLNRLKIWPNPAREFINVSAEEALMQGPVTIKITDLQGRLIISAPYLERTDITSLAEGLYFVTLQVNGKPFGFSRFIKSR